MFYILYWVIPEKNRTGAQGYTFLKKNKLSRGNKLSLQQILQNFVTPLLENPRSKTKAQGNSTSFFFQSTLEFPLLF